MAAKRNCINYKHATYRFLTPSTIKKQSDVVEFDESDVFGYSMEPLEAEPCKPAPTSRSTAHRYNKNDKLDFGAALADRAGSASLPVSIPDWSKVLDRGRGFSSVARNDDDDDDDEVDGSEPMVPPHEYLLSRSRGASAFSVQVGAGRTLKGRDLSRVRDAVWAQIGFQD